MKFRIIEYADGYGKRWFRPQYRGWGRWKNFNVYARPGSEFTQPLEFPTNWEAEKYLARKVDDSTKAMRREMRIYPMDLDLLREQALKMYQDEMTKPARETEAILEGATYTLICVLCGDVFYSPNEWDVQCPKCKNKPEKESKPAKKKVPKSKKRSSKK